MPKIIFFPNKISRIISTVLVVIINVIAIFYGIANFNSFTRDVLIDTINIGFTVVLAIVALAITVFQTDKELLENRNSDENVKKVYLSYIFSIFPIILELILGYLVAYIFENYSHIICLYFMATVVVLTRCITETMASFVAFLNIRD